MKKINLLFIFIIAVFPCLLAQPGHQHIKVDKEIDWEYYEEKGIDPFASQHEPIISQPKSLYSKDIPDEGILLIPNSADEHVMAFNPVNGELIDEFYFPSDSENMTTPIHVISNFDFTSYLLSDQTLAKVQQFDKEGIFEKTFAPVNGGDLIGNIRGMYMKDNGNLLLSVAGGDNEHSVVMFDTDGVYLGNFIEMGAGGLEHPWGIIYREDYDDYLVSASGSNGIHRYDSDGEFIEMFVTGLSFPQQMQLLPNGNILVAHFSSPAGVYEYDSDGNQVGYYDVVGSLRGVMELDDGNIMVTNSSGVYIINRDNQLVETVVDGVNARHIGFIIPAFHPIPFYEFFTGVPVGEIPDMWERTHDNWGVSDSDNAGGEAPEMEFFFSPAADTTFRLTTPLLDGTDLTELDMSFMHSVDDWSGDYDLKVQTSLDGETWEDQWSLYIDGTEHKEGGSRDEGGRDVPPTHVTVDLDGLAGEQFYVAFVFEGASYNINSWYIDDVIVAEDELDFYTLTLEANPEEGGTVEGGGLYIEGEEVTVNAIPEENWVFVNWTDDDGQVISDEPEFDYTMPAEDVTLTANFAELFYLTLSADPEDGGSVEGEGWHGEGSEVAISADPEDLWYFVEWTGDTEHVDDPGSAETTVTMPGEDIEVIANFEPMDLYTVTFTISDQFDDPVEDAQITIIPERKQRKESVYPAEISGRSQNTVSSSKMDSDPDRSPISLEPSPARDMFDLLFEFPPHLADGEYSVITDGEYIYTAHWNDVTFQRYEMDGDFIESFTIAGATNMRDLTYDGTYFYGSDNSSTVYEMCFENEELISTFTTTAVSTIRGIAYDPQEDGFWTTSGFNPPLTLIDRDGDQLDQLNPAIGSLTGLGWDNYSDGDGPYLWVYAHPSPDDNILKQVEIATGDVLQTFDVSTVASTSAGSPSGGMTITDLAYPGKWAFLGTSQNDLIWCLELTDAGEILHTDADGKASFLALPGDYNFSVDKDGYESFEDSFTVVDEDKDIEVTLEAIFYDLILNAEPEEGGSVEGEGEYLLGEEVDISAEAAEGWEFIEWTGDTDYVDDPEAAETTVTMPDYDVELTANFEQIPYTLTLEADPEEGGSVEGEGEFYFGEEADIKAEAEEGWMFIEWTGDTDYVDDPEAAEAIVTMPADDIMLTANFEQATYTLTLNADPEEGGSVDGEGEYYFGEEVNISATPEENWVFLNWSGDTDYVDDPNAAETKVTMPAGDVELTANFEDHTATDDPGIAKFSVYPNPARDKFNVESNQMINEIRLIDVSGQEVINRTVDGFQTEINVNNLKPGVYFMQIHTSMGITTERVQISR